MKKKIILFPFNGNAIEALDCVDDNFEVIGFIDDSYDKIGQVYQGIKVLNREVLIDKSIFVLAVPGSPTSFKERMAHIESLNLPESRFVNVIHSKASVSKSSNIGINNLIMSGVVITSNAQIGSHNCILPNTVIHHDSNVGDFNLIGSNVVIAGHVKIGSNNYIGSATSFKNNLKIGHQNLFGLGSNVVSNFENNQIIYGNPARIK